MSSLDYNSELAIHALGAGILYADDEETDGMLLALAHKEAGLPYKLVVVQDGQEAVDYLSGAPPYADRAMHPLPGLLLLDLKMPRMDGFDVLAWISARPELEYLPVVILSSSSNESDMAKARQMGARDYLVKPHNFRQLTTLLPQVVERWLVQAPPGVAEPRHAADELSRPAGHAA